MPPPASTVKRPRAQTQSSAGSPAEKKRAKRVQSPDVEPSDDEGLQPDLQDDDHDNDDDDGPNPQDPIAQVAAQTAKSARGLTAAEKRARFLTKFQGKTPEQVLDTLSQTWRSDVYTHFTRPVIVGQKNGDIIHRFVCKVHPTKHVDRKDYQDSTGNLTRHRLLCEPEETAQTNMINAYAAGTMYSPARVRYLIAMWCARRHRPFTIVDDPEFVALLRMLYGKVKIPSRFTVSRDIRDVMVFAKSRVVQVLKEHPGRIHLCVDGWTSPNVFAFLGITVHWYKGEELQHLILDFVKLTAAHTGVYLAEKLGECLTDFGIETKVFGATLDNAANNIVMLKELQALIPEFRGLVSHVRCFGHILNLVVKACLSQFSYKGQKPRPINAESGRGNEGVEEQELDVLDEAEGSVDRRHLADSEDLGEDNEEITEGEEEVNAAREAADTIVLEGLYDEEPDFILEQADLKRGRIALQKIIRLSQLVWHNPTLRAALAEAAGNEDLNSEVLVRAVRTRWNTVTLVLERALDMREVLGEVCDMAQFNGNRQGRNMTARLRRFILEDDEWLILEKLYHLLHPFLFVTNTVSSSKRALVHEVIPFIDLLTEHLDKFRNDEDLPPVVRAAAYRGRALLDKYYTLTDESIVYRVAMILHPRYKLQYFRNQGWPDDWISDARDIVVSEWRANYRPSAPADEPQAAPAAQPAPARRPGRLSAQASANAATRAMFEGVLKPAAAQNVDALEVYLETPTLDSVMEPMGYWNALLTSARDAPLARMALDFLSIPATSVEAERAFSRGRLTVSRLRHSLGDESVRASTLLGSWATIPGLIPDEDGVSVIREARRKERQGAGDQGHAPGGGAVAGPSGAVREVIELE